MRRVITILLLAVISINLSGCIVHRINIQQGNLISESQYEAIHRGMTQAQVEKILGTPVLENIYRNNQLIYVYYFKPGYGKSTHKTLILQFLNGRVTQIIIRTKQSTKIPKPKK